MNDALSLVLPFASVLLGAAITYAFNVRQRRRTRVEDVFHEAIGAVAVAHAAHDWIAEFAGWRAAEPGEVEALNSQLGREGNYNYARAVAEARAALARASVYAPDLMHYVGPDSEQDVFYREATAIMARLRRSIDP